MKASENPKENFLREIEYMFQGIATLLLSAVIGTISAVGMFFIFKGLDVSLEASALYGIATGVLFGSVYTMSATQNLIMRDLTRDKVMEIQVKDCE